MPTHNVLNRSHKPGLDLLRLLAAVLVFTQHTLSSCHMDQWIEIGGWRIGRIGTSLFFMLAGFLASSSSRRPMTWLIDRLKFLFPPFWLVTLAGFLIAAVTRFKTFDLWQVVCQLSGMGYFTHGERIVNVATWFMSPLLLMYGLAMFARLTHPVVAASAVILAGTAASLLQQGHAGTVECHGVTFFTAFLIAAVPERFRSRLTIGMAAAMSAGVILQPEFRYGAASLLLLAASEAFQEFTIPAALQFTKVAYEWFLVHGLCITLITRQTQSLFLAIPTAAAVSLVAAVCLKQTVFRLRSLPGQIGGLIRTGQLSQFSQAPSADWTTLQFRSRCCASDLSAEPVLPGQSSELEAVEHARSFR